MIEIKRLNEFKRDLTSLIIKHGVDSRFDEFGRNIAMDIIDFLGAWDRERRGYDFGNLKHCPIINE